MPTLAVGMVVFWRRTRDIMGKTAEQAAHGAYGRLKVLIVANAYPPAFIGGAEIIAHSQAKMLMEYGHEALVFAGKQDNESERYSLTHDQFEGVPVIRVSLRPRDYSPDDFNFFHRQVNDHFGDVIDTYSPDVVHFHNIMALSVSLIEIARRRNVKTVMTLHDHWGFCHKNTLIKRAEQICDDFRRCEECMPLISGEQWTGVPVRMRKDFVAWQLRKVDRFISPSQYLASQYEKAGIGKGNTTVIWNGIDVDRFARVGRSPLTDKVRFSFVGYLGRHKGVDTIIDALPRLEQFKERVSINFVGAGEQRPRLERRVREAGWSNDVRFWGKVANSEMDAIYGETDVLLLPSITPENQPVCITEAMAAGIPVIASRLGGIPELVEDGKTGFLFRAGDATDLATKMTAFLTDPALLGELGEKAQEKIRDNTTPSQVAKIVDLYREDNSASPLMPSAEEHLILCQGKTMPPVLASAIERLGNENDTPMRVVMVD